MPCSASPPLSAYAHGTTIAYEWRGDFENTTVNALHAEGFNHRALDIDWLAQIHQHSLGWVCARRDGELVGFVNVARDGGVHAFILDTVVRGDLRRSGSSTQNPRPAPILRRTTRPPPHHRPHSAEAVCIAATAA